jgi:tRNA pseudouridine55 synthase
MEISCSKGTYIRTLCDDIGVRLGTGAHLAALQRTGIGFFDIKDAVNFDDLGLESWDKNADFLQNKKCLCPVDFALSGLREIIFDDNDYRKAMNGVPVLSNEISGLPDNEFVRLKGPSGNLFGIGRINSGLIRIERILNL